MIALTLLSTAGGVGRTLLTAHLAMALAHLGRDVLAVDIDPRNGLGLAFGLDPSHDDGLAPRYLANGDWNRAALLVDGVRLLPFGNLDVPSLRRFEQMLARQPDWLATTLDCLDLPADAVVLIDAPPLPSLAAMQAARAATVMCGLLRPDGLAVQRTGQLDRLTGVHQPLPLVMNLVDPTDDLANSVLDVLHSIDADRIVAQHVHADAALREAQAADQSVFDYAPHSQVAHDLRGLARWLASRLDVMAELADA